ncbi:MAG: nucleotidyltransferase domain-containing protein [Mycobacteriales bacterium]
MSWTRVESIHAPAIPHEQLGHDWDAWTPAEINELLAGVDARWSVIGGWALDVWRGHQTRDHADLEIATPQFDFTAIRERLSDCEFFVAGRDGFWPVDGAGGHYFDFPETWARDRRSGRWKVDVIRNQYDGDTWVCQAERSVRMPYDEAVAVSATGIPYLKPELVLLYKGIHLRPGDDRDLSSAVSLLTTERRSWLANTLLQVRDPHPWKTVLV